MALHFLSGLDTDFIGAMPGQNMDSARARRAARARAREEAGRAILAARKAAALEKIARKKIEAANRATQKAAALSMDEFGRRGGKAARQEQRQARQEAKAKRQEARQVAKAAKKQAQTARKAAAQAQRAQKAAARAAARTTRKATRAAARTARTTARQTAKTQRKTTRATNRAIRRTAPQLPEPPMMEEEVIMEEEPIIDTAAEEPEFMPEDEGEFYEAEEVEDSGDEGDDLGYFYLGLDEIGGRGKAKRQAKRTARKQKRTAKKQVRQTKRAAKKEKRGGGIVKKIAAAPMRAAFLLLLKVNALKLRTRLRQAWIKDRSAVINKVVKRFGFNQAAFLKELNRKERQQLSGAEFGFTGAEVAAALAAAAPIIAASAAVLRSLGLKSDDVEKTARDNGATSEDFQDIPGTREGAPESGGNNKLLLLGGGALLLFLAIRKSNS